MHNRAIRPICFVLAALLAASMIQPADAISPPPVELNFPAGHSKSDALDVIVADDQVQAGTETRDQGMELDTSSVCKLIVDIWAGKGANATLEVDGLPTSSLERYQSFPYFKPIHIIGPASPNQFYKRVKVINAPQNYTWFWLHIDTRKGHGPIHVLATGVRCPH
jgi:hypothetical protein